MPKNPIALEVAHVHAMLDAEPTNSPRAARARALLALLCCNLRASEAVQVRVPDVNLERNAIHVRRNAKSRKGKGRWVPIAGRRLRAEIANWIEVRRELGLDDSDAAPLLCTFTKGKITTSVGGERVTVETRVGKPMATRQVNQTLDALAEKAGLATFERDAHGNRRKRTGGLDITPHSARHAWTIEQVTKGGLDLASAQQLLGHEDLSSTSEYVKRLGVDRAVAAARPVFDLDD